MARYLLRNRLIVEDVNFAAPRTNTSPSLSFRPSASTSRKPIVDFTTSSDVDDRGVAQSVGYAISALCKTPGFTDAQMRENDIRFMQLVQISEFSVVFAGRKSADGMLGYSFTGPMLQTLMLDCVTNPTATAAVSPPFYHPAASARIGKSYFPSMSDTPGFRSPTDEVNSKTGRWNYLQRFRSKAEFLSYAVFVHKDGTREPLEGWEWSLERLVELRWRNGVPQVFNQMSVLKPGPGKTVLAPGGERHRMLLSGVGAVVNVVGNAAQTNFRTGGPGIAFFERDSWTSEIKETFFV